MGKVIYWELSKKLKFDHTTKWYMYKLESVLEKQTHKILWSFEIQTDHRVIINKKRERTELWPLSSRQITVWFSHNDLKKKPKKTKESQREKRMSSGGFYCSSEPQVQMKVNKTKMKEREKFEDFALWLRRLWNRKVRVIPIIVCTLGTVHKGLKKRLAELEMREWIETIRTTALLRSTCILCLV